MLNIGVSMPIPKEDPKYQLFRKTYRYEAKINREKPTDATASKEARIKYDVQIIGLIEADRYRESVQQLDPWVIALLTTFLILALFGLPFFKMLFIAEDERLSSTDVIASGISVVVGTPILIVVFLSLMDHYHSYREIIPDRLKTLSEEIGERFEAENKANVYQLHHMSTDSLEESLPLKQSLDSIQDEEQKPVYLDSKGSLSTIRQHFKFISKVDGSGEVAYHIALINNGNIENTTNLASRPYYKDYVASKNRWVSDALPDVEYVMRPVVSVEDQTEEAVYILQTGNDSVSEYLIGASRLKSVHDAILPYGYQFAIVDELGEVWFHSESGRATLENLFRASREPDRLRAAITGRIHVGGTLEYRDKSKLFNVDPIADEVLVGCHRMGWPDTYPGIRNLDLGRPGDHIGVFANARHHGTVLSYPEPKIGPFQIR